MSKLNSIQQQYFNFKANKVEQMKFQTQKSIQERDLQNSAKTIEEFNKTEKHEKSEQSLKKRRKQYSIQMNIERKSKQWTDDEIQLLFELYLKNGAKWSEMTKQFVKKSQNELKNKFYGNLRRFLRNMNNILKQQVKFTKPIKYQSLSRVLDIRDNNILLPETVIQKSDHLRQVIVKLCSVRDYSLYTEEIKEFVSSLNTFNLFTRCYRLKKGSHKNKQTTNFKINTVDCLQSSIQYDKIQKQVSSASMQHQNLQEYQSHAKNSHYNNLVQEQISNQMSEEMSILETYMANFNSGNTYSNNLCEQAYKILGIEYEGQREILDQYF